MSTEKLARLRSRLCELTGRSPVRKGADGLLVPSWAPSPDSIVGRAYARDPEYARRSGHNYAVFEIWQATALCERCGGPATAGWGVLPDPMKELLDPAQPPRICHGCSIPKPVTFHRDAGEASGYGSIG